MKSTTRITLACYGLLASALLLAGLLIAQLQRHQPDLLPAAQANMLLTADQYSFLTARTRNNEDGLFVIDNRERKLLIYRIDTSRKRMEPLQIVDIDQIFRQMQQDNRRNERNTRGPR
ncbi:MAG: hypothetical protein IT442_12570 [Phycisphaeraceae bacterium]|nr:hypothetical protein [Phycisphaeraceae bacterium]